MVGGWFIWLDAMNLILTQGLERNVRHEMALSLADEPGMMLLQHNILELL